MSTEPNNDELHVFIGAEDGQVFCQIRRGPTHIVTSRNESVPSRFGELRVMPPVGTLLTGERRIAKDRLRRYMNGYIACRHFRNQLWEMPNDYSQFRTLLESSWPGVQIASFDDNHGESGGEFSLIVREGPFSSEVAWVGHGLQAWMQTIWFLGRSPRSATIVLDEPDVYLHADVQRRLIKLIDSLGFKQSIVATHSFEIIADVSPQSIVAIQKREKVSRSLSSSDAVQTALGSLGSALNVQLSTLAAHGRVLFVEGKDQLFLLDIAYKLGP